MAPVNGADAWLPGREIATVSTVPLPGAPPAAGVRVSTPPVLPARLSVAVSVTVSAVGVSAMNAPANKAVGASNVVVWS